MPTLWIIHREAGGRGALARLAGAGEDTVLGAPTDHLFESAGSPDIVILGLVDDFEAELEFVHRVGSRLSDCGWILVPDAAAADEAVRLFDTLPAEVMAFPPSPLALRRAIHSALQRRGVDSLSQRRARDELAARFAHWFADLELPDLLRAFDPQLHRVPLLVRGESGTGRTLVARYVHAFAGKHGVTGGRLIQVTCDVGSTADDVLEQIRADASDEDAPWSLWLEDVDRLAPSVQRRLQSWIEFGLPDELAGAPIRRWMAGAGDGSSLDRDLEPRLAQALAGVAVRIPPLRHRTHAIEGMISDIATRWSRHHRLAGRHFAPDAIEQLSQHPWPGNVRELEAVVTRTLASTSTDPVSAVHLRFDELEPLRAPAPSSSPRAPAGDETARSSPDPQPDVPEPQTLVEVPTLDAAPDRVVEEPVVDLTPEDEIPPDASDDPALRRLVGAVAHEVRNPLTSIRTFAELLPERFDDPEFRERFAELVGDDVRRIEQVVTQLQELSGEPQGERKRVDVASLLEQLLDERREIIRSRNLLVLRELDRNQPYALGDPQQLNSAFRAIIEKTLELVPERGDVYVASRHHGAARGSEASLRILVRYHGGGHGAASAIPGLSSADSALDFAVAEAVIRSQSGALTLDTTDASETVLVIDLPAPAAG